MTRWREARVQTHESTGSVGNVGDGAGKRVAGTGYQALCVVLRSLDLTLQTVECSAHAVPSHAQTLCPFLVGMMKITAAMTKSSWTASVK